MTPNKKRQLLLPLVAVFAPWRLARALELGARFHLVLAAAAGLLVVPVIEGTFHAVEYVEARDVELPAPQAGLMATVTDGVFETEPLPLGTVAIRILVGAGVWLSGGFASGFLAFVLLLGVLHLVAIGTNAEVKSQVTRGAAAMTSWLVIATLAFALFAISRASEAPAPLVVGSVLVALWVVFGAAVNAWSMLRHASRARAVAGALTLGALVLPIAAVGMQPAWLILLLWQRHALDL
jgi:hypothetical protein